MPGSERGDRVRRGKGGVSRGAGAAQARGRGGEWSIGELAAMDEPEGHPGAGSSESRSCWGSWVTLHVMVQHR